MGQSTPHLVQQFYVFKPQTTLCCCMGLPDRDPRPVLP